MRHIDINGKKNNKIPKNKCNNAYNKLKSAKKHQNKEHIIINKNSRKNEIHFVNNEENGGSATRKIYKKQRQLQEK